MYKTGLVIFLFFAAIITSVILPWSISKNTQRKPLYLVSVSIGLLSVLLLAVLPWGTLPFLPVFGIVLAPIAEIIVASILKYNSAFEKNNRQREKQYEEKQKKEQENKDYFKSLYPVSTTKVAFADLEDIGYGFLRFRPYEISILEMTEERKICDLKQRVDNEKDLLQMTKQFYKEFNETGLAYTLDNQKRLDTQMIDQVLHDENGPFCLILGYGLGDGAIMSENTRKNWPDWYKHYAKDSNNYAGISMSTSSYTPPNENIEELQDDHEDIIKHAYAFAREQIIMTYDKNYIYEGNRVDLDRRIYKIKSFTEDIYHNYQYVPTPKYEIYDTTGLERIYIVQPYFDLDERLYYLIDKGSYISSQPLYRAVVYDNEIRVYEGNSNSEIKLQYIVRKSDNGFDDAYSVYRMK